MDDFEMTIGMLDQGGPAFYPIAIVAVQGAIHIPYFCMVDVPAHHAIKASFPAFLTLSLRYAEKDQ